MITTWRGILAAMLLGAAPVATPMPPLTLELVGRGVLRTDQHLGRVLVLDLWTTWCAPCRGELADLDAYAAAHPRDLTAVAVLAERSPDARTVAARIAALRIPVAWRPAAGMLPLANNAVPTTYILDRHGAVVLRKAGAFAPGELRARLDTLIGAASLER